MYDAVLPITSPELNATLPFAGELKAGQDKAVIIGKHKELNW